MQKLRILYRDQSCVAVDKPAGVLVHRSTERVGVPLGRFDVIRILRSQFSERVYPVHRLDRATSGVLVLARNPTAARELQRQFQKHETKKVYIALIRGWMNGEAIIDSPLTRALDGKELVPAITRVEPLVNVELPEKNARFSTSRFSLVKVSPVTGRIHQIRRHLKRISHPIIGDTVYGDGLQNQILRRLTNDRMLYLKAYSLEFTSPETGERVRVHSQWNGAWHRCFDQIGVCPRMNK